MSMTILHSADWHLGQEFYSYDRREEHEAFFSQLETIIRDEQPDVLVVSGDIYHTVAPSNTVMRMFTDALVGICNRFPSMKVVLIAGNHDSSSRLEINRALWARMNVSVIGSLKREGDDPDFSSLIVPVHDGRQQLKGYVVAVPHIFNKNYPAWEKGLDVEEKQRMFYQRLAAALGDTHDLPVVMMAHMALTGSNIAGHDNVQGNMEYLPVGILAPVPFDYLALGHIHYPQEIPFPDGERLVRYSGSPYPINFDEGYTHSVTLVRIGSHRHIEEKKIIPFTTPWPVVTLPVKAQPLDEALGALADFPAEEKAYIRLHVRLDDVAPVDAMERAEQAARGKQCRFCGFKWERGERAPMQEQEFADLDEFLRFTPLEVAERYYRDTYRKEMDDEMKSLLEEVCREVEQKQENS